ncbi:hypothetical protein QQ054_14400 [Oscillatoria amoena NRMC-F 0135]|nr:hypothetical protein [Oscillatoria amoena NRMC-F 0135]
MRLPDIFSHAFTKYVLALALAMIAFCASLPVSGPAHFPDETAYLANASAIAGFHNDLASSYHAGYSIIIAPAFYFGKTPETIWLYVKLINALLYFVTILSLFSLAKILFPETKCTSRMIAVLITAFYPIYFIMPGYSFSESAFLCFFILTFLCFERVRNDSSLNTVLFALLTGYLYWIHPKGIVVGIAAIMALAYIALRTRRVTPLLIFLPLYSMTLIIYKLIFVPWLYSRMTISGAAPIQHYPSVIDVVLNLLTLPKLAEFMGRFSGQAFYLIIGSVGLVMIGLMSFWIKSKAEVFSRGHLKIISSYHATFIFLTLCLIGMMTMTALSFTYFSYTTRLDQWMYGRYTESVIAPLILAGVISVMGRGGRAVSISKGLTIILSVCFFASILWLVIQPYDPTSRPNISAFWQDFFVRDYGVLIWAICGLIPIIFLILYDLNGG